MTIEYMVNGSKALRDGVPRSHDTHFGSYQLQTEAKTYEFNLAIDPAMPCHTVV